MPKLSWLSQIVWLISLSIGRVRFRRRHYPSHQRRPEEEAAAFKDPKTRYKL